MAIPINKWFLCSFIVAIFSFLRSLLSRKANKEKLDLPLAKRQGPDGQEDAKEPEEELQNWDSWDDGGGLTGVTVEPAEPDEADEDFFADMTPSFRKAALIRKKTGKASMKYPSSSPGSNQLGIDDTANLSGELGAWTESSGGWEEEAVDEDMELEADSVLKEKREAERTRRLAEQHRKKAAREAQRSNQRGTSSKLAVKLG